MRKAHRHATGGARVSEDGSAESQSPEAFEMIELHSGVLEAVVRRRIVGRKDRLAGGHRRVRK